MPPIDTSRPCGALADTELAAAVRSNLLGTLYSRFGDRITEMASRSLGDAPLTAHDAADILKAAATLSVARNAAFTSAGLKLTDFTWAERDRARVPDSQHGALLAFCAEIVRECGANPRDVREAAGQLHDRVRAYLEKRGHWPIVAAGELEVHAKPAARMLAVWNACDAS
jgi:hypothetical protein